MAREFAFRHGLSVAMKHPKYGNDAVHEAESHANDKKIPYEVMSAGSGSGEYLYKKAKDRDAVKSHISKTVGRGLADKFRLDD